MKLLPLLAALLLSGCATIPGETACQRAQRAAATAHALVNAAVVARLDPVIIAKLTAAADAADRVGVGVCAAAG